MALIRSVLMALLLVAAICAPAWIGHDGASFLGSVARAAPAGGPLLDNDNDDDNDDNWNGNGNWNENNNHNGNSNDNDDNDNDDNGNGNDNEGDHPSHRHGPPPPPPPPPGVESRCYAAGEIGAMTLILDGGSVTLDVVPASSFPRVSNVTLKKVDPSSMAGAPTAMLDSIVFEVRALDGCDGNMLAELPSDVNLGVAYSVPATSAKLRFALLDGSRWVDIATVPDPSPSHPYVSATIRRTGTYLLYQMP